jgi:hypothetical protein
MDSMDLLEIRKQLASLPVLQDKANILRDKIKSAKEQVDLLLDRYKAESLDVEKLQRDSLRTLILKNFGRYEDKLDKESEELLAAKLEYDKAAMKLKELETAKAETEARIAALLEQQAAFENELARREAVVKSNANSEVSRKYAELEAEQEVLVRFLAEAEEAGTAARRAYGTAGDALEHLRSAENWATYDAWTRGGIISHIAKYEHIDNAQEDCNRLNSQLEDLQKELRDLNLSGIAGIDGIDSATRTIDFWFDNIFTDMSVRARISDDYDSVSSLRDKISSVIYKLGNDMEETRKKLAELDRKKKDLLVGEGEG